MADFAQRRLPGVGAWRVHPCPVVLPRLAHDGPGLNRYDDPQGHYAVRYVAENLSGALLETMARFRPAPEAEITLISGTTSRTKIYDVPDDTAATVADLRDEHEPCDGIQG